MKLFVLAHQQARQNALRAVAEAPEGYEVSLTRSNGMANICHLKTGSIFLLLG